MIQVDTGGHPPIPLIQNGSSPWQFYYSFLGLEILTSCLGILLVFFVVDERHEIFDRMACKIHKEWINIFHGPRNNVNKVFM
jgi:hypothetical protein